jgi:F-type H+-transporting ATPase subunit b
MRTPAPRRPVKHRAFRNMMVLAMRTKGLRAAFPNPVVVAGWMLAATPLFAAEGTENGWGGAVMFLGRVFNLAVVIGLLVWVGRKPLADFYASRSESIREQLGEARRARLEAESKLAEIESRMSHLDQELAEMRAAAEKDADQEYKRLIEAAEEEAKKLIVKAREEIDGITREAYLDLKAHAADLAVHLAGQKVRGQITDEDRRRLFENFLAGLEEKK